MAICGNSGRSGGGGSELIDRSLGSEADAKTTSEIDYDRLRKCLFCVSTNGLKRQAKIHLRLKINTMKTPPNKNKLIILKIM